MTIDLTQIIVAIIGLLSALISAYLVPYIKAKTTAEERAKAIAWTKIAVEAAEMIYNGPAEGEKKFAYVKRFLIQKGFDFNEVEIKSLIEAAVLEMKAAIEA